MAVINTNVSAMYSQNAMKTNARAMDTAMQQLSTGTRVNSAKDDAAGLAIGQNMTAQIRGLNMAVRDLNDGINMIQTAEGAMVEQTNMLQRMRELAVQSMNGTYSDTQRSYLDKEFQALSTQIGMITANTKWNDQTLLDASQSQNAQAGTFKFQAGISQGQTIVVSIAAMTVSALGFVNSTVFASGGVVSAPNILTMDASTATLGTITNAIDAINVQRAGLGAAINRMQYSADNLTNVSSNTTQSRSSIMDTDYALATTQLAKTQIIQQAATAMLAQANQQPQQVMALLKG